MTKHDHQVQPDRAPRLIEVGIDAQHRVGGAVAQDCAVDLSGDVCRRSWNRIRRTPACATSSRTWP